MQSRILIFLNLLTASLSNFCIRSSFSMLQLHSGGMHHEQWWVWLQDGGKAIDALMHGITISASVSRKQKEMIVDFRRDGNSQPTCTLDEQLWEWSLALEVPENLNWSYNTSFLVKKTHQCLCFYNIQGAAVYKQSTGIRPGRDYHDFIEQQFLSWLTNGPISSWAPLTAQGGAGHHTSHSGRSLDVNLYAHDSPANQTLRWSDEAPGRKPCPRSCLWCCRISETGISDGATSCQSARVTAEHLKQHGHPEVAGSPGGDIQPV